MNKKLIIGLVIAAIAGGAWALQTTAVANSCVNVYVDYGVLANHTKVTQCVGVSGTTNALKVLSRAGFEVEGTVKYGAQVVCRVNNLPSMDSPVNTAKHKGYVETCKDMPPEFAYWAVLVKKAEVIPNPINLDAKWNWADKGIADIKLSPGDSIGLVFADDENVEFPQ